MRIGFDSVFYCMACNTKETLLECPKFNLKSNEANTILAFHLSKNHGVIDKSFLREEKVFK